jgi:PAS domain S-box-containing protein
VLVTSMIEYYNLHPGLPVSGLTFMAALIYLLAGVWAYTENRRDALNRHFLFLSLFFSIWAFSASFAISASSAKEAFFWFDTFSFSWFLFPPFFLHFFISLTKSRYVFSKTHLLYYLPGIVLVLFTTGKRFIIEDFKLGPLGWYIIYNQDSFWYYFNILHYTLMMMAALFLLIRWYLRSQNLLIRKQAKIVLITFVPASFLSYISGTIIPLWEINTLPPLVPLIMVVWVIGISINITRYKMLIASPENSVSKIIETIHDGVLLLDHDFRILFMNPAFTALSGFEADKLVSKHIDSLFSEPVKPGTCECMLEAYGGNPVPVEIVLKCLYTGRRELTGYLLLVYDKQLDRKLAREMRLRRETADQLKSSDMLFTKAFYLSPVGMLIIDHEESIVLEVNDKLLGILGYQRSEMVGQIGEDFLSWVEDKERTSFYALLESNGTVYEFRATIHDSEKTPIETRISAEIITIFGRTCTILCVTDISVHANIERQLLRMQRMESIGFMASSVAHDLNNILTAIGGSLDLALLSLSDSRSETSELISSAQLAYAKGKNLVGSILEFTRIDTDDKKRVDIVKIINEADQLAFQGSSIIRKIIIGCDEVPPVYGYPELLVQLFMNLFINSGNVLDKDGEVLTEVNIVSDMLLVRISDNGPGIPRRFSEAVFEKAFSTRKEGSGLGLSIVKTIIEKHDGDIFLDTSYGKGASFVLRFPLPPL